MLNVVNYLYKKVNPFLHTVNFIFLQPTLFMHMRKFCPLMQLPNQLFFFPLYKQKGPVRICFTS